MALDATVLPELEASDSLIAAKVAEAAAIALMGTSISARHLQLRHERAR
jgi:hypothetical protein